MNITMTEAQIKEAIVKMSNSEEYYQYCKQTEL